MKNSAQKFWLALICLLVPVCLMAQAGVPNVFNPNETEFQHETHFLTFIGSYIPESATSATAYYQAIDPTGSKATFTKWLVNAGFIANESQWHPSGRQIISYTPGAYGDNVIVADSHVIVLNAADLGFVRNQYIRCKPSCTALNPIIYTYLENYPVAPFATGGSGFGSGGSSFPTQAEADAAIASAINRPLGELGGDGVSPCQDPTKCIERIADVAFEWAPAADGSSPKSKFGQLYAYIFSHDANGIAETITVPQGLVGKSIPDFANPNGPFLTINAGDPFPPNLDGLGFKQHPGVCLVCHGGKPTNLVSGVYPRKGKIDGFRLLPLDNRNLMFESTGNEFSLANQEAQIKKYNQTVLQTVPVLPQRDDDGTIRPAHLAEVIRGWYAGFSGDLMMSGATQNDDFIPSGWREPAHKGTAPAGSEQLYLQVVAPSCRSCHFNRELSLDFGTAANFKQESDLLQLVLLPYCQQNNPDPRKRPMPLAHLTFQRLWESNNTNSPSSADQIANYFGFKGLAGYCGSHP